MEKILVLLALILSCAVFSRADPTTQGPPTRWSVKDPETGIVCILAEFHITLTIEYNATKYSNMNETYIATANVNIPQDAQVVVNGSFCSVDITQPKQQIKLQFGKGIHNVTVRFGQNADGTTNIDEIGFEYDLRDSDIFPNATEVNALQRTVSNKIFAIIPKEQYFVCMTEQLVILNNGQQNLLTNATFSEVKLEAFRSSNSTDFDGDSSVCPFDPTSPATSTSVPSTSTTQPPTPNTTVTTVSPTTQGPPTRWSVKDPETGIVCILAEFHITLTIEYNATKYSNMNETYIATANVNIPQDAQVVMNGSFCSVNITELKQQIKLQFGKSMHNVTVRFGQNVDGATIVDEIGFEYDLRDSDIFPNATEVNALQRAVSNKVFAIIPKEQYFVCMTEQLVILNNWQQNLMTNATFSEVKLEAFRSSNSTDFDGDSSVCPFDPTSPATSTFVPSTTPVPISVTNYTVYYSNGSVCLMADFGMTVSLKYANLNGTFVDAEIKDANNGTADPGLSTCGENTATLVINKFIPDWVLTLNFTKSDNKFSLTNVTLGFNLKPSSVIPNANDTSNHTSVTIGVNKWTASVGHSYKCKDSDNWSLNVTGISAVPELHLILQNIQAEAFMNANASSPQFGDAEECSSDYTSDIVPIAVGCALAALVVIVLIAYVIGRRRNRARGYESM